MASDFLSDRYMSTSKGEEDGQLVSRACGHVIHHHPVCASAGRHISLLGSLIPQRRCWERAAELTGELKVTSMVLPGWRYMGQYRFELRSRHPVTSGLRTSTLGGLVPLTLAGKVSPS
jgi:hypothetical protein